MIELFEIWRNSRQNKTDFLRRVRFFTIDDVNIRESEERLKYAAFWKGKCKKTQDLIDELGWQHAGDEINEWKKMAMFTDNVALILKHFADVVQPQTFAELMCGFRSDACLCAAS